MTKGIRTAAGAQGKALAALLALLMIATLAVQMTAANALTGPTIRPMSGSHQDPTLEGGGGNPFYVYLKAGERLFVDAPAHPTAGNSTGLVKVVDSNGVVQSTAEQKSGTWVAPSDGVWQVFTDVTYKQGKWDIRAMQSSAWVEVTGRVWTERYYMTDKPGLTPGNFDFWLVNDTGYIYNVLTYNQIGIASQIAANSLGMSKPNCEPYYSSTNFDTPVNNNCGNRPFRIFFEEPAADLPASAPINGEERWVKPQPLSVAELTNTGMGFTATGDLALPAKGTFDLDLDPRFLGHYWLEIDVDGNGRYDDPIDRRVQRPASGKSDQTWEFNGVDGLGNVIPVCTPLTARTSFDRVGEIHFIANDVERRDGIRIRRFNGPGAPDATIYWNDPSWLGNRANTTPVRDATGGVNSNADWRNHGWDFDENSWGNNRNIDDWTYVPLTDTFGEEITLESFCTPPQLTLDKSTTATGDTRPGDTVSFTVTATNVGLTAYSDVDPAHVWDDLSDILTHGDLVGAPTATVDGVDVGTVSVDPVTGLLQWSGALGSEKTVTITYSVEMTGVVDGKVQNTAWSPEDPTDPASPPPACTNPVDGVDLVSGEPCATTETLLPRLELQKNADKTGLPAIGEVVTYTVKVSNFGPGDFTTAAPATVEDDLSEVLDKGTLNNATSITAHQGSAAGPVVGSVIYDDTAGAEKLVWIGPMAANTDVYLTYSVTYTGPNVDGDHTLINTACVPENLTDPDTDGCATVMVPAAGLFQLKAVTSDNDPVVTGSVLTYTLTFENKGEAAAAVDSVDHLAGVTDDTTITSEPIASHNDLTVVRTGDEIAITGSVPAGGTYTVTYQVTVDADGLRTDSVLTNFLLPAGETPPLGGICIPAQDELPHCTSTPIMGSLLLQKHGQGLTGVVPLDGAIFELFPDDSGVAAADPLDSPEVLPTAATGTFSITGLPVGTYWIREVQAPQGHTLLAEDFGFTVLTSGAIEIVGLHPQVSVDEEDGTWKITVTDVQAFALPLTGGRGPLLWMLGGGAVLAATTILLLRRSRRAYLTYLEGAA